MEEVGEMEGEKLYEKREREMWKQWRRGKLKRNERVELKRREWRVGEGRDPPTVIF